MYLYALALNRTLTSGNLNPSGSDIARFAKGEFQGFPSRHLLLKLFRFHGKGCHQ